MSTALLQTTYFGPVQWYQKLHRYEHTLIEQYDSYQKQTFRNRCIIATANGLQALTVPVDTHPVLGSSAASTVLGASAAESTKCLLKDVRISDHNQWRRIHWNALQSAYSESPFFEYYADDIRPFFEQKYDFLVDFNEAIRQKMCELIDIHPSVEYTQEFLSPQEVSSTPITQSSTTSATSLMPSIRSPTPTSRSKDIGRSSSVSMVSCQICRFSTSCSVWGLSRCSICKSRLTSRQTYDRS